MMKLNFLSFYCLLCPLIVLELNASPAPQVFHNNLETKPVDATKTAENHPRNFINASFMSSQVPEVAIGERYKAPSYQQHFKINNLEYLIEHLNSLISFMSLGCNQIAFNENLLQCHEVLSRKWERAATNLRSYCCYSREMEKCVKKTFSITCHPDVIEAIESKASQPSTVFQFVFERLECNDNSEFWDCRHGLPIILGIIGLAIILVIFLVATIVLIRRRKTGHYNGTEE